MDDTDVKIEAWELLPMPEHVVVPKAQWEDLTADLAILKEVNEEHPDAQSGVEEIEAKCRDIEHSNKAGEYAGATVFKKEKWGNRGRKAAARVHALDPASAEEIQRAGATDDNKYKKHNNEQNKQNNSNKKQKEECFLIK